MNFISPAPEDLRQLRADPLLCNQELDFLQDDREPDIAAAICSFLKRVLP